MEIYLIRHTSVDVPKGFCYGRTDVPLKDSFEDEAAEVKRKLDGVIFDAVFTSPLSRAVKLAAYCGYENAEKDSRITEFDFGEWEMKSFDELYANDVRFREWCEGNYILTSAPNGESFSLQMERFKLFVEEKQRLGLNSIAAFCHGGILACGLIMAGQAKPEEAFSAVPPYGSVVKLSF